MRFDLCEAVLVALFDGNIRPPAMLAVAPRAVFEEGYLRRWVAKPECVVKVEIGQLVRTDHCLGVLRRLRIALSVHQLPAHLSHDNLNYPPPQIDPTPNRLAPPPH